MTAITKRSATLSTPNLLVRLEYAAATAALLAVYAHLGFNGWVFLLAFLLPDLAALGYLANTTLGAGLYNLAHTLTLPLLFGALALALNSSVALAAALIWATHITMDRAVGYGLKYATSFKDTHMDRL